LKDGVIKTSQITQTWINAILCESIDEYETSFMNCSMTLKDTDNENKIITCPNDCDKTLYPIYGDNVFHEESSICKAVK